MKTRIKVVKRANGRCEYLTQYRSWATWPLWAPTDPLELFPLNTIECAKKEIDRFLRVQSGNKSLRDGVKVVGKEYIKYP